MEPILNFLEEQLELNNYLYKLTVSRQVVSSTARLKVLSIQVGNKNGFEDLDIAVHSFITYIFKDNLLSDKLIDAKFYDRKNYKLVALIDIRHNRVAVEAYRLKRFYRCHNIYNNILDGYVYFNRSFRTDGVLDKKDVRIYNDAPTRIPDVVYEAIEIILNQYTYKDEHTVSRVDSIANGRVSIQTDQYIKRRLVHEYRLSDFLKVAESEMLSLILKACEVDKKL